ncbi:hypothetical protein Asera_50970 [Actinocatenispora sera]|uniref:DUF1275 domain-containing protein n=2 Tax=Actinocatenispora sera TaxID=390989 RepID=A0A810L768_9ACTN|nr:hypothetical protein Asera_50970 [Actinocatenispora sera]
MLTAMSAERSEDEQERVGPPALRVIPDALLLVLAAGAGATDALSYLALGHVFTAVMTGNLALLGIAAGTGSGAAAVRSVVSLAGYVVGVAVCTRFLGRTRATDLDPWPVRVTHALGVQAVLQLLLFVGWLVADGRPTGIGAGVLVAVSAVAMGFQARAVQALALPAGSTTYLTSTLTTVVSRITGGAAGRGLPRLVLLVAAMLAGAAVSALLVTTARLAAGVLPFALTGVAVLAAAAVDLRHRRRH